MIFADKLILLRKKAGWSQEELAEQMNVTRQSVSKWEGAQSVPDLQKLIRLSELFGVTTDYLLKDEIEEVECVDFSEEISSIRRVSMEEANNFLAVKAVTSKSIAWGVLLCILSPVCLFVLGAIGESPEYNLSENVAGGIGMIILLILVAVAVAIFIASGSKTSPFEYLEKEVFETEYGVSGMVKERREQYKATYTKNNVAGTCLCIMAFVPLFGGAVFNEENELFMTVMFSVSLVIAGIGVVLFVRSGIVWESFEKLLQEGGYTKTKKGKKPVTDAVSGVYWLIATAIYLGYSLATNDWGRSWIIWVVAGVLFPAVLGIVNVFTKP